MSKRANKSYAENFNKYIVNLGRGEKNDFLYRIATELEITIQSLSNLRYGNTWFSKLKREKIEQIAGTKIFEEDAL